MESIAQMPTLAKLVSWRPIRFLALARWRRAKRNMPATLDAPRVKITLIGV